MTPRPFRFGVNLLLPDASAGWQAKARRVEDLGYDVLQVPDHLGAQAPFPALAAAAEVTTLTLGTFVLNAGLHNPALLTRDVTTFDRLFGGRLEVGLGAGYDPADFEAAGVAFPRPGERVDALTRAVRHLRPTGLQPGNPPLLIAGDGDRVLTLAARQADIVGLTVASANQPGVDPRKAIADRVGFVRAEAGSRGDDLELNLFVSAVALADRGSPNLAPARLLAPDLSGEELLRLPTVLAGSPRQIAETLLRYRDEYGITYFSVLEFALTDFAEVIALLR